MRPTALVVSTVHSADDTRIRERLIRTLSADFEVLFASREPAPADEASLTWVSLPGGRVRRNIRAAVLLFRASWDVAAIHDPELIPVATLARKVRKRPIVFDVHEDLASQVDSKEWIAPVFRPFFRWLAERLYAMAERSLTLTLAEESYLRLFVGDHVVFPNYPRYEGWPPPSDSGDGSAIYVGDTQTARGLDDAVEACGIVGISLTVIGPVDEGVRRQWGVTADAAGIRLGVTGRIPNPEAIARVGRASVGLSPLRDVPNYRHSLPTKTLEYLAMGVPVVATDLPGTRDVLGSMKAVELIPSGDVDAMAAAISRLSSDEARTSAYQQADSVRRKYAWPSTDVLDFYTQLVSGVQ